MFKPLSQLNRFFQLATERKLSGSDQLMYLHIFNKFNQAHWTETLRIKDAELKDLMRLYDSNGKPASIDTIRRSRQRLKAKGFIDFTSGNGYEPEYRLPCLYPADSPADSPTNTPADSLASSYIRTREDAKDVKTEKSVVDVDAGARTLNEVDELVEYWERELRGGRLSFEHQSELSAWLKSKGYEFVKEAMREASDSNGIALNMKLLRKVIESKANPQPLKGGDNYDRKISRSADNREPTRIEYKEPEYTLEDYKKLFGINSAEEYEQAGLGSADEFRKRFKLG